MKKNREAQRQSGAEEKFFFAPLRLCVSAFFFIFNHRYFWHKTSFLILFLPLLLSAADTFTPAPLMPLLPGDPLELNLKLRDTLYNQDESEHNLAIFKTYTIPWLAIIPLLLLALLAPLFLYVLKNTRKQVSTGPSVYNLIQQMQALQDSTLPPKELAFEVAKLFKMGFENGPSMTYQELFDHIKDQYSEEDLETLYQQFNQLEKIQYQRETPSYEQVKETLSSSEHFLKVLVAKNTYQRDHL